MEYRRPTYQEIEKRVEKFRFGLGVFIFLIIGLGGQELLLNLTNEPAYIEIIYSAWWLPSLVASYYITHASTHWIIAWVPEEEK